MASFSILFLTILVSLLSYSYRAHSRPAFACGGGPTSSLPFCMTSRPIHVRARDLVSRLTVEEKTRLLVNNAAGVPRLGIAGYEWWSEALHGVSNVGPGTKFGGAFPGATAFPQVITTAASFNATLWEEIGKVVSDEGRAMYNGGQAGLTFWSPNVNIYRDPRWGRGQETPGEDPVVVGKYAAAYVRGLQQPYAGNRLKLAACCKHYTAYDLDNWRGVDRFHFNARVSKQDLEDTYNVPFKMCVAEGKAASIMCSYNQVNGIPTCADRRLLLDTIRGEWQLDGYIVSDCDSVGVFFDQQHYTKTPAAAAAAAIKAGLDLDCGPFLAQFTGDALRQNLLGLPEVDNALINTVTVQMRLGMYDGETSNQPFGHLGPQDVCSLAHQHLALEAAKQGLVLLKNDRRALPLSRRLNQVAVIGPNSDATVTMIGNYAGIACKYTSPLLGISRFVKTIHEVGCRDVACVGDQPFGPAINAARTSDATILVVGLDQSIEAEARDRDSILLPGRQQELITKVAMASRGPIILVLMCGGPVDVTFARNDPRIQAIIWVGYPGQAGGQAIAEAIFGLFSPGGKLPMTWYPQDFVVKVPMTEMGLRPDPARGYPGRTHRFYRGPVVYGFGYGLTYTSFRHDIVHAQTTILVPLDGIGKKPTSFLNSSAVRVSRAKCEGVFMPMHVNVENDGDMDGTHTMLVFSTTSNQPLVSERRLVAFQKVFLASKSSVRLELNIDVCKDLSFADVDGIRRIPIGQHHFHVGKATHSLNILAEAVRL